MTEHLLRGFAGATAVTLRRFARTQSRKDLREVVAASQAEATTLTQSSRTLPANDSAALRWSDFPIAMIGVSPIGKLNAIAEMKEL